jgi:hypothetical protein
MSALAVMIVTAGHSVRAADAPPAAEGLLRLVPADVSLVVTIEGLRDHARSIGASRLAAELRQVPAVKAWLESEKFRHWQRACSDVESVLGVKLAEVRDQVLGDAVVLAMQLPDGAPPDPSRARGLLVLRARDPALLARLIDAVNSAQQRSGELARVADRRRGGTTYHVREFPLNSGRPPEWYVGYPDGTFAFSNSEAMIQGVVDRKPPDPGLPRIEASVAGNPAPEKATSGLGDLARLAAVRRRLPDRALARLYVDPRAIERLFSGAHRSGKPSDDRIRASLERHLASVEYAGAALVWSDDGIVVHAVETLDPKRVDGWIRRWAGDSRPCRPELRRVPKTALALASAHVNLTELREAIETLAAEPDQPRIRNLEALATGLLLGEDLSARVLPVLGPAVIAYVDAPAVDSTQTGANSGRGRLFPVVVVVDLAGDRGRAGPSVADALDNALRTILAMVALDEKRGQGRAEVANFEAAGVPVRTLSASSPFAYAVDRYGGKLVLGTSAACVVAYLQSASAPDSGGRFRAAQGKAFPEYETFLCVDLDAVTGLAGRYRDRVARSLADRQKRPVADVERDLDQILALARLFRSAFVASRIEPDASAVHRCFGVIVNDRTRGTSVQP